MREHKPFALMKKVNETLGDSLCVRDAYASGSSVTFVTGNESKVHKILQAKDQLKVALSATEFERQESWIKFLVQPVPKNVQSIPGIGLQVEKNALMEKTERITIEDCSFMI
ncbi:hypothetical protein EV44_g5314 [Erysiphe necator]|uniref:Uncharacterized protein n=1 Tax=Uncinula necator TaxID=52586 RepID=A0A0B1P6E8_UNCNE|nr:hypothetical protein EV44_g5314 [Erysiphe necator]